MTLQQIDVVGLPQPGRIRAARDLRQLTQQETVDRMSRPITGAALSQIEAGKVRPTEGTLRQLAAALDVPVGFFSAQWPDSATGDVLSHVTYFRDLAATPAKLRRRAAALALLLSDLVSAIELHVRIPEVRIPSFPVEPGASREEIDDVAEALRGEWDLGEEPIPHVVREIERRGVPVARLAIGTTAVDAFSVRFNRRPIILLTDDKSSYVRSRFDAAHELGHLVMHGDADAQDRSIERQAHDLASSLLLPRNVALLELPRRLDAAGWARLAEVKRHWGLSMSALLYRARDLQLMTPEVYRNGMKYMSARGWRTNEPGDREMGPPEAPALFEQSLRRVSIEGNHSTEALIASANLPLADTLALIHAAVDARPRIDL